MSLHASKIVWDSFAAGGNVKLALLCLADFADDWGENVRPSMATIARRLACSESQARRAVHRLLELGALQVTGNASGGAPGTCRQYRIELERLTACAGATRTPSTDDTRTTSADATPQAETGSTDARDGSHGCAQTPSTDDTRTVIELPRTVRRASRRREEITLQTYLAECRNAGVEPIPADDVAWDYAEKVGLSAHLLELCWKKFREQYLGPKKHKRYKDWRQHFRNCVDGNWYRLWFHADDGIVRLSSQGRAAEKVHASA